MKYKITCKYENDTKEKVDKCIIGSGSPKQIQWYVKFLADMGYSDIFLESIPEGINRVAELEKQELKKAEEEVAGINIYPD